MQQLILNRTDDDTTASSDFATDGVPPPQPCNDETGKAALELMNRTLQLCEKAANLAHNASRIELASDCPEQLARSLRMKAMLLKASLADLIQVQQMLADQDQSARNPTSEKPAIRTSRAEWEAQARLRKSR